MFPGAPVRKHSHSGSKPSGRQPIAAVAPYGPDTTLATKLVVSVLDRSGRDELLEMRVWTTQAVDVRHDPTIGAYPG